MVTDATALARLGRGARSILGRELSATELAAFGSYLDLLVTWQRTYRLVGSSDPRWIVDELLLDSLLFTRFLPSLPAALLDLGSGAGIPGIPLKLVVPSLPLTLLEARRRRASFLATAIRVLRLTDARVVPSRSEEALEANPELRAGFRVVVSRCAGELQEVLELARPFVERGGRVVISGPPFPEGVDIQGSWTTLEHPTRQRPRTFFVLEIPRDERPA